MICQKRYIFHNLFYTKQSGDSYDTLTLDTTLGTLYISISQIVTATTYGHTIQLDEDFAELTLKEYCTVPVINAVLSFYVEKMSKVSISFTNTNDQYLLLISNTYSGTIRFEHDTSVSNSVEHGLGSKSL